MRFQSPGRVAGLVFLLVLVLGASCGKNPLTPPQPPQADAPAPPRTTSILLAGPASVAPGASAPFTLTAHRDDGSALDVTAAAIWSSTTTATATVSAGQVRGLAVGESTITARYTPPGQAAFTRSTQIIVVPDGTFRVTGFVSEAGLSSGAGVPGARVEVTSGTGAGLSTITVNGSYRLYGLAGDTRIVVTKAGYRDEVRELRVLAHQTVSFVLFAGDAIPALEGSYALTLAAAPSCGSLQEDLRVRTYHAEVSRSGRSLTVNLSGATFVTGSNSFSGRIDPDGVTFQLFPEYLGFYYYSFGSLVETIETNRLLFIGSVAAQLSGNRISGTLAGRIEFQNERRARISECTAQDHQFNLQKQ